VKSPDTLKLQWDNFFAPFSLKLWIALVGTILVIAVHFTLIYYLGRHYGNQEADSMKFYTLSDSLLLVLGIFCQQGERRGNNGMQSNFIIIITIIIIITMAQVRCRYVSISKVTS
jgi:hypothetical protein